MLCAVCKKSILWIFVIDHNSRISARILTAETAAPVLGTLICQEESHFPFERRVIPSNELRNTCHFLTASGKHNPGIEISDCIRDFAGKPFIFIASQSLFQVYQVPGYSESRAFKRQYKLKRCISALVRWRRQLFIDGGVVAKFENMMVLQCTRHSLNTFL
jgi:hypothetical protein